VLPATAWEDAVDLRNSLQALSRRQRDAVILHYYLGFDLAETANLLGCAEGTIHSHLNRARKALERSFEPKEANC
jgi:RNA polymerase sigma-70 factor (ECF subfamily)